MSFRLVPKSGDLERRYFTEFGKPVFQHITKPRRSVAEFMQESIAFCSACTM